MCVVVLVDRDDDDCRMLKASIEEAAREAGMATKSGTRPGERFQVLIRLAIEELESWFFGDVEAIVAAYPGVSPNLANKAKYRDPDAISGGTWEALERELQKAGYFKGGLAKIEVARQISAQMDPVRNRSRSFRVFREGLLIASRGA